IAAFSAHDPVGVPLGKTVFMGNRQNGNSLSKVAYVSHLIIRELSTLWFLVERGLIASVVGVRSLIEMVRIYAHWVMSVTRALVANAHAFWNRSFVDRVT